jgi:hypothetical protein
MVQRSAILTALCLILFTARCGRSADLELRTLECGARVGLLLESARGEVENVSSHSLPDVFVVVTFRSDDNSTMRTITRRVCGALRPGEVSRFEVSTLANPEFSTCEVVFTNERREVIPHLGGWFEEGESTWN